MGNGLVDSSGDIWRCQDLQNDNSTNVKGNSDINKEVDAMSYSTFDFLHAAAYGTTEEVRGILDSGVDVNARNEGSRETALMTAAGGGNLETVQLLIERGADVNAKSVEDGTALLVAIEQHNEDVVDYLLAHGANANDKLSVEPGLTALCMAAQRGYDVAVNYQSAATAAAEVVAAYRFWNADCVVVEVNQGGDLIANVLRQVDPNIPVRKVRATRGKIVRAEPIAVLYEQGRAHHVGVLRELEEEMTRFTSGATVDRADDRVDALVWAASALAEFGGDCEGGFLTY